MEIIGGLVIAFGLFTRLTALSGMILMFLVYYSVHLLKGILPWENERGRELLFFTVFYLMLKVGNGRWNLEKEFFKKEIF